MQKQALSLALKSTSKEFPKHYLTSRSMMRAFAFTLQKTETILMRRFCVVIASLLALIPASVRAQSAQFSISFPKERSAAPLDGRLLLLLSTDPSAEPRNQISISYKTQAVFGVDVDGMKPGQTVVVN
ncbi:MAG TPA: hypothetical protein VFP96_00955, partial [Candidatus Acidoferrum sp.]|nr:hypothetical protein [Candidatus Acidoferrum sp.]